MKTPPRFVAMLCLFTLVGCQTFQDYTVGPPPPELEAQTVRVHTLDGSQPVLESPRLEGGQLVGEMEGAPRLIALDSITAWEVRKNSAGRTALLVAGITAIVWYSFKLLACAASADSSGADTWCDFP